MTSEEKAKEGINGGETQEEIDFWRRCAATRTEGGRQEKYSRYGVNDR